MTTAFVHRECNDIEKRSDKYKSVACAKAACKLCVIITCTL